MVDSVFLRSNSIFDFDFISVNCRYNLFQVYYYNARTRESAWTKPENVKIITQSEVEAMAAQAAQGGNAVPGQGPSTAAQAAVAQGKVKVIAKRLVSHG